MQHGREVMSQSKGSVAFVCFCRRKHVAAACKKEFWKGSVILGFKVQIGFIPL